MGIGKEVRKWKVRRCKMYIALGGEYRYDAYGVLRGKVKNVITKKITDMTGKIILLGSYPSFEQAQWEVIDALNTNQIHEDG